MPARFSSSYVSKIRRGVLRYQKEYSRLKRSGVSESVLPQRITFKGLMNEYYSKREMNKALKEMSLFTARKATTMVDVNGKEYSQYEVERFRLQLGRERKATSRELSLMTGFDAESPLAHNQYIKRLQARQVELSASWQNIIGTRAGGEVAAKTIKSENFYENWIYALFQDAEKLGFPKEKLDEMIKKLSKLTPQQFERLYAEDPAITYIFSFYNANVSSRGKGKVSNSDARDAFKDLYERLDRTIERYKNIK